MSQNGKHNSGFTLVELLVAMALLALVTAGAFSIYNSQHKVTHVEAEVVDVQQNLRMAMDYMTRDIRMSGFLLTGGEDPIASFGNGTGPNGTDVFTVNTASATGAVTRIDADLSAAVTSGSTITFTVSSVNELSRFNTGDVVRIINAGDRSQPANTAFTVAAKDASVPSITLSPQTSVGAVDFKRGFLVARTGYSAPDTYPNTIRYCVGPSAGCAPSVATCPAGQLCVMRIINNSPDDSSVIATNVQDLQVRYVLDGSAAEVDSPASLPSVRDVKVTLRGVTVQTAQVSGAAKTRELTATSKIRNRI